MVDLNANLDEFETEDLLAYQQEITRLRLDAIDAGRRVQAELDRRAADRAARRAEEDRRLGAIAKPPPQQVFGDAETDPAAPPADAPSGVLRKADR